MRPTDTIERIPLLTGIGETAKSTDKNKEKEKIERIAGQVVDATVKLRRALGPRLLESTS